VVVENVQYGPTEARKNTQDRPAIFRVLFHQFVFYPVKPPGLSQKAATARFRSSTSDRSPETRNTQDDHTLRIFISDEAGLPPFRWVLSGDHVRGIW
jgi:hypothetical protein